MPRYIDADELIKDRVNNDPVVIAANCMPTVDVVEVVRCKDCQYSRHWYRDRCLCDLWDENGIDSWDDGYCFYGKRKEKTDGKAD